MQRYLRVKRNEHYWDADRVALEGIVFRPIESDSTEEKMFRSGQLHATGSVPNTKIPTYRSYAESPLIEAPYMSTYYYMLNTRRPPLDNVKVRRALALAIDRKKLADSVLEGTVLPSSNYIPLGMPGYDYPQVLSFDPGAARQLLAEAGYPGGQGFPEVELIYNTSENHRTVAVAVQQMWKEHLNVEVQIANQEWKVYLDTLDRRDYTIARMGWIGDVYPGSFLDRLVSDSGTNRIGFSNPDFDDIILNQVRASHDKTGLMRLYREAERLLLEETPLIPIYSYKVKRLVQPGLRGLPANQTDSFNYKYVELAEQAAAWQPQASLE
jgi:oligopeptide transport system substrate-binding protein